MAMRQAFGDGRADIRPSINARSGASFGLDDLLKNVPLPRSRATISTIVRHCEHQMSSRPHHRALETTIDKIVALADIFHVSR